VNNIKINLGEIEWSGVDWINLAEDRYQLNVLMNAVMIL
jgi:hypothetical protein